MIPKLKIFTAVIIFTTLFNIQPVFAANKKIIVEAESKLPPFSYAEQDGTLSGFQIDLFKILFQPKDYDVNYIPVFWDKAYNDVKSGKADSCGLVVINDSRKKDILFTKPILQLHVATYIKKGAPPVTPEDLSKYSGSIGVVKGNFTESILKETVLIDDYKTYSDEETALNALKSGEIKVLFECQESINYLIIKDNLRNVIVPSSANLFPVTAAFGVSKSNPELVKYINERFDYLIKSGVYEELYENNFFTHSSSYISARVRSILIYILIILIVLIAIALFIRSYISHLKRQLVAAHFQLYNQHEWLRTTLSSIGDAVIATDNTGLVTFLNSGAENLTGFTREECLGRHISEVIFLVNETSSQTVDIDLNTISSHNFNNSSIKDTLLIAKDGHSCFVTCSASPIKNDTMDVTGLILVIKDITEIKNAELKLSQSYENLEALHEELTQTEEELRKQYYELLKSQQALEASEERYKLSTEGANDGLWDWDLKNKNLFLSQKCYEICGYEKSEVENTISGLLKIIHPDFVLDFKKAFDDMLHKKSKHLNIEFMVTAKDKGYIWLLCRGHAIFDAEGRPIRAAGSFTDITERKKSTELIEKIAYTDSLTGLPNRAALIDYIKFNISKHSISGKFAVLFLDLDNFKSVNDTKGHYFGDELLKAAAEKLKSCIEDKHFLARLGGDEFMIILNNLKDMTGVTDTVDKILVNLSHPFNIKNSEVNVTTSIGIAVYPDDGLTEMDIIKNADTAMYKAKESGKNKYIIFSSEMNKKITERVELENYLRHAISKEELIVYYQPQIDIKSGQIISMEALLRWKHPHLGMVSPDTFISLAEECGLIKSIGEWVLKSACRQNKLYQNAGYKPLRVAVNLSAKQFQDTDLYETVMETLNETGLAPEYLELEITESAALQYFESTIAILKKLMDTGITISLDDFGTGYSSLNYLKTLPINAIKIDKSFIQNIPLNGYEHNLTKSIISIAHDLGLKVVAEGVETDLQYSMLKKMDCDTAQGYLLSRPIPAFEFEKLLV